MDAGSMTPEGIAVEQRKSGCGTIYCDLRSERDHPLCIRNRAHVLGLAGRAEVSCRLVGTITSIQGENHLACQVGRNSSLYIFLLRRSDALLSTASSRILLF